MESLGQSLREEREARSISLEEIASATKIVPRYLEALEADRLDLMPGGFFIKGIIRAYAQAVGLDPEKVLARYKSAGILAGPEPGKGVLGKHAAPAAVLGDRLRPEIPPAPVEPPPVAEEAPAMPEKPGPSLVFEEASAKPGRAPMTRRQMLTWAARGLAALVIVGTALLLWAPWRRRSAPAGPGPAAVQAEIPAAKPSETPQAPAATSKPSEQQPAGTLSPQASQPVPAPGAAEPAAAKPEAAATAPAADEAWEGLTIEISFEAETWIQVYADGILRIGGLFPAGGSARAQASEKLLIHTGNAGGFTFKLNGRQAKPLGRSGQVLTGIEIRPANLKDFLEAPSSPRPAG
jgi:cytoskeleton protein RodZ